MLDLERHCHWGLWEVEMASYLVTDLESEARLLSVCRLVPLADGSIIKTEVIVQVEVGLQGG